MTYEFVHYTDNFEEITIAKANYKRPGKITVRLSDEADKLFGKGKWEQVTDYDTSLSNVTGWYARRIDGDDTLLAQLGGVYKI